jgi:serine/threonine-protein kinase
VKGRRLSRFLILDELGRGGMATVWKASDELLGRLVALKVLSESLSRDPSARRRFRREAEISALLEHPSIVPVYEAGEADDLAFMVMRLIDGETLAAHVAHRLPPVSEALRIGQAAAAALGFAHSRGVIHRDVTARNVMIATTGSVYVLDFGLARVPDRSESTSAHVTGTVPYLAPESLRGGGTDWRSDIYSLGVVLYEALTGARPLHGESIDEIQYKCLQGMIDPPSRLRPELTPEIDAVVMRALAREPADRHASADELAEALGQIRAAATRDVAAPPAPGPATAGTRERAGAAGAPAVSSAGLAGRFASGEAPAYLAVLPIESRVEDSSDAHRRLLDQLAEAARAGLAHLERLHVVPVPRGPDAGETERAFARRVGANLILRSSARFSGSSVRITFVVIDSEHDRQIAGGIADGSLHQAFDLEDRLVAELRRALGIPPGAGSPRPRAPARDPAAAERFTQALGYMQRFDNEASLDGAIAILETLTASDDASPTVHATLARAYLQKGSVSQQRIWEGRAAAACERAVRLDPDAPRVRLALGEIDLSAGRWREALERFDGELQAHPGQYEALLGRARALDGLGLTAEAESTFASAIALQPGDWRGYHRLGLLRFRRGSYATAIEPWLRVVEITPDNPTAYRNLGSAYFHMDRYVEAEDALRRSIAIRPSAVAYYNLGTVLFFLERHDDCVAAFEKAVDLNPANPLAWGNLGNACRLIPGREARAAEALERAIGLMRERLDRGQGDGESWARLAGWYVGRGCTSQAEEAIGRALQLAPDDVDCQWAAGHVLFLVGRREEALEFLARAVRSGYGVDALRRDPDLRPLHNDPEFQRILAQGTGRHEAA